MKVVIDTNVLIATMLKDSLVRFILLLSGIEFYFPENALGEIKKHKGELIEKLECSDEDFESLLKKLLENVKIINSEKIKEHMGEAEVIMKDIDIDDSVFIATAMAENVDGIWTFDKHFSKQRKIKIFSSEELLEMME